MAKAKAPKKQKEPKAPKQLQFTPPTPTPSVEVPLQQPQTGRANVLRQGDLRAKFGLS